MNIKPRDNTADSPAKSYLRTGDAASYIGMGRSTLERMRLRGDGPAYRVLGSRIVIYAIADLDAFVSRDVRLNTAQAS